MYTPHAGRLFPLRRYKRGVYIYQKLGIRVIFQSSRRFRFLRTLSLSTTSRLKVKKKRKNTVARKEVKTETADDDRRADVGKTISKIKQQRQEIHRF